MSDSAGIDKNVTRRGFLEYAIGIWGLGLAAGVGGQIFKFLLPPKVDNTKGGDVKAAGATEIAVGDAKKFDMNGKPGLLIHMPTGYFAVSAVCTHLGCIVSWDKAKKMVVCPCHNGMFDYHGNIVGGPAPKALASYTVAVKGDGVMVSSGGGA